MFHKTVCVFVVCLQLTSFAQTPVPTSFTFPIPLSFLSDPHGFGMTADETGMHLVYLSGTTIRHALIGANGRVLLDTTIAVNLSGNPRVAVSSTVRNDMEELDVVYRNGDSIYVKTSTDGGSTWITPVNSVRYARTSTASKRIECKGDGDLINVTWDTGSDGEVLYERYNHGANPPGWEQYFNVTDESNQTSDSVIVSHGSYPAIVVSEKSGTKRVHVVYINERKIDNPDSCTFFSGDSLSFQQIVERSAIMQSQSLNWEPNDIMSGQRENPCPDSVAKNLHGENKQTYPVVASGNGLLAVVHSSENFNFIDDSHGSKWMSYHNSEIKTVDYRNAIKSDPVVADGPDPYFSSVNPTYVSEHSVIFVPATGEFKWFVRMTNDSLYITSLSSPFGTKISYAGSVKTGSQSAHSPLALWRNDGLNKTSGYQYPRTTETDVAYRTNFTSKNKVLEGASI